MSFLRSSGVRHRKWKLLGVKLPDFTVGISSHCIIRGYSLSLASVKLESSTAIHGVGRPGTTRLSRRLVFFNDLSMSAACMEDQV